MSKRSSSAYGDGTVLPTTSGTTAGASEIGAIASSASVTSLGAAVALPSTLVVVAFLAASPDGARVGGTTGAGLGLAGRGREATVAVTTRGAPNSSAIKVVG